MIRIFTTIFLLVLAMTAEAQKKFTEVRDLRSEWKVYEDNQFVPVEEVRGKDAIYFQIESGQFNRELLLIYSPSPVTVLLNGAIARQLQGLAYLKIDSLAAVASKTFTIGLYADDLDTKHLETKVVKAESADGIVLEQTPGHLIVFKDFVVVAGLVLVIIFVVMIRVHSKLSADYFSFTKIFSLRETDDSLAQARLNNSANTIFYIFCSLMLGLYLMIVFNFLDETYSLVLWVKSNSFWVLLWKWISISVVILLLFALKILVVVSLSNLFGLRGIAGLHFFNWMRSLLIICGVLYVILFVYFITRGQNPQFFSFFLKSIIATLAAWTVMSFLKLNGKVEHTTFHLFSYICATEIIPLLITVKVLFQ